MRTMFGPVIVFGFLANTCWAGGPEKSQPANLPPAPPDEPPVVRLVVSPAAEPVPALKYRLLPTLAEQTPGNAALEYSQAVNRDMPRFDQNKVNRWGSWLDLPPDRLPVKELETELASYARAIRDLERASRREVCDWQLPISRDGFSTNLDDFQNLRIPVRMLALKARLQIARGDLDGALSTIATTFKVSHDCNQGRLFITSLIACAIAGINSDSVQSFVQQPQAPNLYWALTDLPSPLVECREAVNVEAMAVDYEFPQLAVFRSRRLGAEEARHQSDELLTRWFRDTKTFEGGFKTLEDARAKFASAARAANDKQALLDSGWSKADVAAMAPEQIAWLISDRHWRICRDELVKWAGVPAPQALAGTQRSQERFKEFLSAETNPLADFELVKFMPTSALLGAVARRDRVIACLRVIEALRMHAATHEGKLPSSLEAIEAVPIPVDAYSGKPFVYHLNADGTADLQTPAVHPNNRAYGRHYVIQMRVIQVRATN
jgi:hypothetical protein